MSTDEPAPAYKAGTKVWYVPSADHALTKGAGGYPWELAFQGSRGLETLTGTKLDQAIESIRRSADPAGARQKLVLVRPRALWPAVVVRVGADGRADLDVQSNNGGVTLHLTNVACEPQRTVPHSFKLSPLTGQGA